MAAQPCGALGQDNTRFRPVRYGDQDRRRTVRVDGKVPFVFNLYAECWIKRNLQPAPPVHAGAASLNCAPLLQMLGSSGFSASAKLASS